MKPFDLEKAKQGHTLITRNGQPARLLCYDLKHEYKPLVAAVLSDGEEITYSYTAEGRCYLTDDSMLDLFLTSVTHTRWALLGGSDDYQFIAGRLCNNEAAVKEERLRYDSIENLRIVEISWSE